MNLMEFKGELEKLDMPIQYQSFSVGQAPDLPYLIFYEDDSDNLFADNANYFNNLNLTCELYSDTKDLELETKLHKLFYDNEIEYNSTETYIDSENMFMKAYSVSIIFDAMADVKVKEVDKSKLQSLIDYVDTLKTDDYEQDGFDKLKTSLAYAKASLIDNETTQDEVDDNLDDLIDCLNKIILIVIEVDRSQLQQQIDYVDSLSASNYSIETWAIFDLAFIDAKKVLSDENATQTKVDNSLVKLIKGVLQLQKIDDYEKGRNLFAPLYWNSLGYEGGLDIKTGEINNYDWYVHSNFIEIPKNALDIVLKTKGSDSLYAFFYDKNKKFINYETKWGDKSAYKIQRDAEFMRISSNEQTPSSLLINQTKIEWDEATDYTIAPEDEKFNTLTQI